MPPIYTLEDYVTFEHVRVIEIFMLGILLSFALGAYLFARGASRLPAERLSLLLCPVALFITLSMAGLNIYCTPDNDWNSGRLAPAIGLLHGAKLYASPYRDDPVLNTIYPPMAYLPYLPAGIFSTPTPTIWAASCISLILFLGPIIGLTLARPGYGLRRHPPLLIMTMLLAFLQTGLTSKALNLGAFFIHADAPMLGFTGLAALILYLRREDESLSLSTCIASSFWGALAIWGKQTSASMVAVLPLWVLITRGFRPALRYTLALAAMVAVASYIFVSAFGQGSMFFNIFHIPSKHHWTYEGALLPMGLEVQAIEFLSTCALILGALSVGLFARRAFTPPNEPEATEGGLRRWFARNPWMLFALLALAAVPTSALGRIKLGGWWNSYAPTPYFLTLAVLAMLLDWHARNRSRGRAAFNAALGLVLMLLVLVPPSKCSEDNFLVWKRLPTRSGLIQDQAYLYAAKHPGTAYFPLNPLSSLQGEGRNYHFVYGLWDWELAGQHLSRERFAAGLPDRARYVCLPPYMENHANVHTVLRTYMPDFGHGRRVTIEELPGWVCYEL